MPLVHHFSRCLPKSAVVGGVQSKIGISHRSSFIFAMCPAQINLNDKFLFSPSRQTVSSADESTHLSSCLWWLGSEAKYRTNSSSKITIVLILIAIYYFHTVKGGFHPAERSVTSRHGQLPQILYCVACVLLHNKYLVPTSRTPFRLFTLWPLWQ